MAEELFLIDGNSLAYRAFFALPESIATSTGVPTNAIFGFASMLVKILTDYGPKATVVVWDAGWSGRKEVYSDYKAQRTSRPDLLREQWPHLEPLVDAFGYRNLKVDGYEADDVIASQGHPGSGDWGPCGGWLPRSHWSRAIFHRRQRESGTVAFRQDTLHAFVIWIWPDRRAVAAVEGDIFHLRALCDAWNLNA